MGAVLSGRVMCHLGGSRGRLVSWGDAIGQPRLLGRGEGQV